MDAAAKNVQKLLQTLPDKPYHLAKVLDKRYRVPPDHAKVYEEREYRALQYMSLLADADRGLLFTRPYYDMREEPPNPSAAKEAIAKTEKKAVTKLSLSDYKNKQKKTSDSPPDPGHLPPVKSSALRKEATDPKTEKQAGNGEGIKRRAAADISSDAKTIEPRTTSRDDSRSSKPDTKPRTEPNDTPEKRKRSHEDDSARPAKKSKPDVGTPVDDRSRTPRDETPKKKDAVLSQDRAPKAAKPSATSSLPNGRAMLKGTLGSQSQAASRSPQGRSRSDSINGTRPESSASNKNTPTKRESSSAKPGVPPLLSPLHHPLFRDGDSPPREKRKRAEPDDHTPRSSKPPAKENSGAPVKRERSPLPRLPPLLSPTLPPMIEEELVRAKKTSRSKSDLPGGDKNMEPTRSTGDARSKAKVGHHIKYRFKAETGRATFEVGRARARKIKAIFAQSTSKTQRSASLESMHGPAKKRPVTGGDYVGDSISVKRPRTSETTGASKMDVPSTPAKAGTSMSRVASNNSAANTPGETSFTPIDRPPTRQGAPDPARIKSLRERHNHFRDLGSKLKHKRDALLSPGSGNRLSEADHKLGVAWCLESALSYMLSFRALFESRRLENKAQDPKTWEGILPLLDMIKPDVGDGRDKALEALYLQLKAIIVEELVKCYWSLDPASNARAVLHFSRLRSSGWKAAAEAADKVEGRMRASFGPWTSVDDAVHVGIKIVRRWCAAEDVDWGPEQSLQQANGTGP